MKQGPIVAVISIAAVAGAAVYFAAPAPAASAAGIGPVLVDGSPAEVLGRLRAASLGDFLRDEAGGSGLDAFAGQMRLKHEGGGVREDHAALWLGTEKVLEIVTRVRPAAGRTEVDVSTELPPSSLTRLSLLTPQDRTVMAALADHAASDYIAFLAGGVKAGDPAAQAHAVEAAFGLDARGQQTFEARVHDALKAAFGDGGASPGRSDEPSATTTEADPEVFGQLPREDGPAEGADAPEGETPQPIEPNGFDPRPDQAAAAGSGDKASR